MTPPLDVLADVLAGDKNSRLYKRLVYDMQVAQDVSAFKRQPALDGKFQIIVTPKPGQTPTTMAQLVTEEIDKIATRRRHAARARARAEHAAAPFLDRLASVLGKADRLDYYNYFVGTPDYVAAGCRALRARDRRRRAARRRRTYLSQAQGGAHRGSRGQDGS